MLPDLTYDAPHIRQLSRDGDTGEERAIIGLYFFSEREDATLGDDGFIHMPYQSQNGLLANPGIQWYCSIPLMFESVDGHLLFHSAPYMRIERSSDEGASWHLMNSDAFHENDPDLYLGSGRTGQNDYALDNVPMDAGAVYIRLVNTFNPNLVLYGVVLDVAYNPP